MAVTGLGRGAAIFFAALSLNWAGDDLRGMLDLRRG